MRPFSVNVTSKNKREFQVFRKGFHYDNVPDMAALIYVLYYHKSWEELSEEKKVDIWLSLMTKAPSPTGKSKKQRDNTKTPQKLRLHNDCGPTLVGHFG